MNNVLLISNNSSFIIYFIQILSPFFWGILIAFLLNPPMYFFVNQFSKLTKKNNLIIKGISLFLTYMLLIFIFIILFLIIFPQIMDGIYLFLDSIEAYITSMQTDFTNFAQKLPFKNLALIANIIKITELISEIGVALLELMASITPHLLTITSSLLTTILNFFVTLIFSISLLLGKDKILLQIKKLTYSLFPQKTAHSLVEVSSLTIKIFSEYISDRLGISLLFSLIFYIFFIIFNYDYPILLSIIIAVSSLIPFVGTILGVAISIFLIVLFSPGKAFVFLILFVILKQIELKIIYPKFYKNTFKLPIPWILFGTIIGGRLFGILGAFFSIPILSLIYILLKKHIEKKETLGNLF